MAKTREQFAKVVSQQFMADCTQRKLMEYLPEDAGQHQATRFVLTPLLHTGARGSCNALRLVHHVRSHENFPPEMQPRPGQKGCAHFFEDIRQVNWGALGNNGNTNQDCRCDVTMTRLESYIQITRNYTHIIKKQYGLCVKCVKNGLLSREDGNCGGQFTHAKTGKEADKSAEGHECDCVGDGDEIYDYQDDNDGGAEEGGDQDGIATDE